MSEATAAGGNLPTELDHWTARKIRPVVILYVAAVFVVFITVSIVIFDSPEAVKALLIAAVGAVAATVPGVMERDEYRMTASGIERRVINTKKPRPFRDVFRWDELSRIVPMRHGFKYYKALDETSPLRRFWKVHLSDTFSGEVHVENADLERVLAVVERQGIVMS